MYIHIFIIICAFSSALCYNVMFENNRQSLAEDKEIIEIDESNFLIFHIKITKQHFNFIFRNYLKLMPNLNLQKFVYFNFTNFKYTWKHNNISIYLTSIRNNNNKFLVSYSIYFNDYKIFCNQFNCYERYQFDWFFINTITLCDNKQLSYLALFHDNEYNNTFNTENNTSNIEDNKLEIQSTTNFQFVNLLKLNISKFITIQGKINNSICHQTTYKLLNNIQFNFYPTNLINNITVQTNKDEKYILNSEYFIHNFINVLFDEIYINNITVSVCKTKQCLTYIYLKNNEYFQFIISTFVNYIFIDKSLFRLTIRLIFISIFLLLIITFLFLIFTLYFSE